MKRILFMCVANSARSQLAEALAREQLGPGYEVASAGSAPGRLNPHAIAVLDEMDIDCSGQYAKSFGALPANFTENLDLVITLCDEEVCPRVAAHVAHLHWPLPDPVQAGADAATTRKRFRETRDTLVKKIASLV